MRIMKVYYSNMPIPSMYGTFTYMYYGNQPNVGKYIRHGWYGIYKPQGVEMQQLQETR